jgi:hypothetical protein
MRRGCRWRAPIKIIADIQEDRFEMAKEAAEAALAVVRDAAGAGAEADQLDMLMPPTRASMTSDEAARVEATIKHDRRGRPPGARNKTTREMLEFVRKTMGDPLLERFRWAAHTPESLAIVLGCSKLEAFDRLDKIRSELARYFYAQMAQVDGQGNAVTPRLTMVFPGQSGQQIGADGVQQPPWMYIAESQQNQRVIEQAADVSHSDVSHDEDNYSDINGFDASGR